jgi:two-component system NarL family sensor kinase
VKSTLLILLLFAFSVFTAVAQSALQLEQISKQADSFATKNFDSSLTYSFKGLQKSNQQGDSIFIGYFLGVIGKAYYFKGEYDSAAIYFSKSVKILENTIDVKKLADISNAYAKLYRKLKKHENALYWYDKALTIYKNENNLAGQSTILNESGVVYEYMGQYPKAIERYSTSLQISEKLKDSIGIAYAYNFLGGVYSLQNNQALAIQNLDKSLAIFNQLEDSFAVAFVLLDKAKVYKQTKLYQQSTLYLDTVIRFANQLKYPELLKDAYLLQSDVFQAQGDFTSAMQFLQKHNVIKDSLYSLTAQKQIEELSIQYQVQKSENEKQKLKLQISKVRFWIMLVVSLLLISWLFWWFWNKKKNMESKNRLQSEILMQQDLATKAVIEAEEKERNRIAADLHDGVGQLITAAKFNLSSLTTEVEKLSEEQKNVFEKALSLVDQSAIEVRAVSHNIMPNVLLRSGLGAAVKNFIEKIDDRVIK